MINADSDSKDDIYDVKFIFFIQLVATIHIKFKKNAMLKAIV